MTVESVDRVSTLVRSVRVEMLKQGFMVPFTRNLVPAVAVSSLAALGLAVVARRGERQFDRPLSMTVELALIGFLTVGVVIVLLNAAWSYLGERASDSQADTYRCLPARWITQLGKSLWVALASSLVTLVSLAAALASFLLVDSGQARETVRESAATSPWFIMYAAVGVGLMSLLAISAAIMIRYAPLVLGLLILWPAALEDMVARLPLVGPVVTSAMPFNNLWYSAGFTGGPAIVASRPLCLLYLALLSVAVLALALFVENRREI